MPAVSPDRGKKLEGAAIQDFQHLSQTLEDFLLEIILFDLQHQRALRSAASRSYCFKANPKPLKPWYVQNAQYFEHTHKKRH